MITRGGLAALRRRWPQPLLGALTATVGLLVLLGVWRGAFAAGTDVLTARDLLVVVGLAGATIASYQFPLHVRPKTKIYLASAPLYLLVVLVPLPLAVTVGALATLLGELSVRRARRTRAGDTASEVGRRILVLLLGAAVAHLPGAALHPLLALVTAAVALEVGDIVTAPLVLAPITGASPPRVIVTVARAAWLEEGAQYLLGLVGALAAVRAPWAPLLLVGPIALVYYALKRALAAQERAERARQEAEAARAQAVEAADALAHQALHDALTGLPNRTLLHDRMEHTLRLMERDATSLALLLLDLDRFKAVNDTLGHHAGDALLRQVAARMQDAVRTSDTVARLGGDEFAVLLPGTDRDGAVRATQMLLAALAAPVTVEGQTVHVGASIGVALAPAQGSEATVLLRHADVAMYVAKRGGSGYAVYDLRHDGYSATNIQGQASGIDHRNTQGSLVSSEDPHDSDLVARISTGDATALALVYERHSAAAYGLAAHILRDAGVADEVVGEVFLAVWRQPPTDQAVQGLKPWVLGRVCVQALARQRAAREVVARATTETRAAEEKAGQIGEGPSLDAALSQLPAPQHQALLLACVGGLMHTEIARVLAVSDGEVRHLLRGALQAIDASPRSTGSPALSMTRVERQNNTTG